MIKTSAWQWLVNLSEYIQSIGNKVCRIYSGEIVGASFYDDEKGEIRKTPRLYIDMDEDIPVGHYRVYIVEVTANEEGNTND